jgi:hypothetical protein
MIKLNLSGRNWLPTLALALILTLLLPSPSAGDPAPIP